jgi:hypothetical protein
MVSPRAAYRCGGRQARFGGHTSRAIRAFIPTVRQGARGAGQAVRQRPHGWRNKRAFESTDCSSSTRPQPARAIPRRTCWPARSGRTRPWVREAAESRVAMNGERRAGASTHTPQSPGATAIIGHHVCGAWGDAVLPAGALQSTQGESRYLSTPRVRRVAEPTVVSAWVSPCQSGSMARTKEASL